MTSMTVINIQGTPTGAIELRDDVFAIDPNRNCVRQALLAFEANQRQGTHSTKTRGMVSGGGRKPWRQKGTGRARQGSIRAPQWRGGAIIFGPLPRDYNQKINKKVKRAALASALSDLVRQNRIKVLDALTVDEIKTKKFRAILESIGVANEKRVLVLTAEPDDKILRSARNLPNVLVIPVNNVNIYCLLTCDVLVTTSDAIKRLEEAIA
ncbi:MAG: 50S ribosomal protein L4 [Candidatus Sumerlaeaceae bacterium]|nr:50S ribosomal protein L4 [Candidatus Sumerlaeaceae bacterium]